MNHDLVYRLGVMLLDSKDPARLIYRSPNAILEPETDWELGRNNGYWVPNVVFTCGAVCPENGVHPLEADDRLIVYYGASDSVIGAATARVKDLIPESARKG